MRFTWSDKKAARNIAKHGVSFDEAATVFADPLAMVVEDVLHVGRALMIGQSNRHRVLLAVYTELDDETVRIISARRATSHERRNYEEGKS